LLQDFDLRIVSWIGDWMAREQIATLGIEIVAQKWPAAYSIVMAH
jgi:hypothetical protein